MEVSPEITPVANIKVIGVGGGGGNAVNRMIKAGLKGIEFISVNTDAQALYHSEAPTKINVGKATTRGLGAGSNPDLGRQAAEESIDEVKDAIEGADMIVMLASMLHAIGTGNMTRAGVRLICVDISPAVVTKLADRGSVESTGIVTDVGLFLNLLAQRLSEDDSVGETH